VDGICNESGVGAAIDEGTESTIFDWLIFGIFAIV
jgi:hypothetical protein